MQQKGKKQKRKLNLKLRQNRKFWTNNNKNEVQKATKGMKYNKSKDINRLKPE